jgi:hypothetical protein
MIAARLALTVPLSDTQVRLQVGKPPQHNVIAVVTAYNLVSKGLKGDSDGQVDVYLGKLYTL